MALKELKKEIRHCAVSPLIFLWRELFILQGISQKEAWTAAM